MDESVSNGTSLTFVLLRKLRILVPVLVKGSPSDVIIQHPVNRNLKHLDKKAY